MMENVLSFDSFDAMVEAMQRATDQANEHLHPVQKDLTFGSYWVRFADVKRRLLVFGYVYTHPEMYRIYEGDGMTAAEAVGAEQQLTANLERGYMFGSAADRFNVTGELGDTHRFDAWPIDESLYLAARNVGWDVDRLDSGMKALVEIAYQEWRTWRLEIRARIEGKL